VQTWQTLVAGVYHLCWHPQFIDFALNKVPGAESIDSILGSKRFLSACARLHLRREAAGAPLLLSSSVLRDANRKPHQTLLEIFLRSQISRAMSKLNMAALGLSDREDVYELLRYHYILNAGKFESGSELVDGRFRTFGYAAFHRSFIRAAWNGIKHGFQPCVSLDAPTHPSEATEPARDAWSPKEACVAAQSPEVYDVRMSLPAALRDALCDSISWEVFYGHLYKGKTFEEIAPQFDVSPSFLSKRVTSKILQKLRDYFGASDAPMDAERTKISDLRELLCCLLPEGDFLNFVPRPPDDAAMRGPELQLLAELGPPHFDGFE
jgi:hypothetical protein